MAVSSLRSWDPQKGRQVSLTLLEVFLPFEPNNLKLKWSLLVRSVHKCRMSKMSGRRHMKDDSNLPKEMKTDENKQKTKPKQTHE